MEEKNSSAAPQVKKNNPLRVPPAHMGLQINHCKNPKCGNFGIPIPDTAARGPGAQNPYTVVSSGKDTPQGRCNACGEHFPLKSNFGVVEEAVRIASYLAREGSPVCPNDGKKATKTRPAKKCANHDGGVSIETPGAYASFGHTDTGNPRYRCNACGRTFSVNLKSTSRQRSTSDNKMIFKMLVNKVPFARIAEILDITPPMLSRRFDFIHSQCVAFAANRERRLPTLPIRRLYVSVDRQDYQINWKVREHRKNVVLSAVASVDNGTGYCFGLHLNFDGTLDPAKEEAHALASGDANLPAPYRRSARLWLAADHARSVAKSKRKGPRGDTLDRLIEDAYAIAEGRDDVESPEAPTEDETLPDMGMQTRLEYTLYGHFVFLKKLFGNVEKVRFFLDQESGVRAACLAAFADEILDRRADALFVRIAKGMTIDDKRKARDEARKEFMEFRDGRPEDETESEARLALLVDRLEKMKPAGKWNDRWLAHPFPSMSEPGKASCHLTELGDMDLEHQAWLHNKASLHGVDSLFNQIRRRVSMLERGMHSSANAGRVWNGYAPYHPSQAAKALEIMRVVHNFVLPREKEAEKRRKKNGKKPEGEAGKKPVARTPAMRLGLAKAPVSYEDIIYFS